MNISKNLVIELKKNFRSYKKIVRESQRNQTTPNIHRLRFTCERFSALLSLVGGVIPNHNPDRLISSLKKARKAVGALRDNQGELESLNLMKAGALQGAKLVKFSAFLSAQNVRNRERARLGLEKIPLIAQSRLFHKILHTLVTTLKKSKGKGVECKLENNVKQTFASYNKALASIRFRKAKSVHALRKSANQMCYQDESLRTVCGRERVELVTSTEIRELMGSIQDDTVLLKTAADYLKNKDRHAHSKVRKMMNLVSKHRENSLCRVREGLKSAKWVD